MKIPTLQLGCPTPVLHHLRPLSTTSSPSSVAVACMLVASEEATPGSVMQKAERISPSSSGVEPALALLGRAEVQEHLHVARVRRVAVEDLARDQRAAHALGERRVLDVRKARTVRGVWQEEVPQTLRLGLRLELLDQRRNHPGVLQRELLAVVGLLAGGYALGDERIHPLQHFLRAGGGGEVHQPRSKSSTTLPVAVRRFEREQRLCGLLKGKARAHDRRHDAALDHRVQCRADLARLLRMAHRPVPPAGAHHLGVVEQQPVDLHLGDRSAGEAHHDDASVLAQRAQAVGEAIAAHRVEHHVDAPIGDRLGLVLPGTIRAHHVVGAGLFGHALLLIARDHRDRARAEPLRDLQRGCAHASCGAVHEHRLPLLQAPAHRQRKVGRVVVEDQPRSLREVERGGEGEGEELRRHHPLREGAQPAEGRHAVALLHRGAGGSTAHDAPDLASRHEGEGRLELVEAASLQQLREGDPRGVHLDLHSLARGEGVRGVGLGRLLEAQGALGARELDDLDCFHALCGFRWPASWQG